MRGNGKFSKESNEMEEEGANWMDSYSDLVTDLLAIFVVLFSFAMMSQAIQNSNAAQDKNSIAASIESAILANQGGVLDGQDSIFPANDALMPNDSNDSSEEGSIDSDESQANEGGLDSGKDSGKSTSKGDNVDSGGANSETGVGGNKAKEDSFNKLFESIKEYIDEEGLSKQLSVKKQGDNQILLRVAASVFFDIGRAVNVLRYLLEISPLGPQKFSAVDYGEFHPIAENDTEANRIRNRRVDFIIEATKNKSK